MSCSSLSPRLSKLPETRDRGELQDRDRSAAGVVYCIRKLSAVAEKGATALVEWETEAGEVCAFNIVDRFRVVPHKMC